MAVQTHPIRRLFARFFPRKITSSLPKEQIEKEALSDEQKYALAQRYLNQGELQLLQGNLNALSSFEAASDLDGQNHLTWYRQGLAFFEYGSEEGREKSLLLAGKYFKTALQLNPGCFNAWVAWGNALLQLGRFHQEHHFLLEAKEKYQRALELSFSQPQQALADLWWDYGIAWSEIAKHSGEALDTRLAIDAFQNALKLQAHPTPEFWNDCGKAYLEMGLLINDDRLYFQSIDYLQKSVVQSPSYFDGWMSLAEAQAQLYINTLDERFATKAFEAYASAAKLAPQDPEVWLGWGQLLGESGRINRDPKKLHLSIEKCARAATLDPEDPIAVSQWVESLSILGSIASRLDFLIEAEHKILKATEQFPDDPDLWRAYGICLIGFAQYYADPDYYEMAIEKLQYGLSTDRTDAEIWHTLGVAHKLYADLTEDVELIERASRFLSKAMDLKPSCPALTFDTACALLLLSEVKDDLPSLEQAIGLFESLLQKQKEALLSHPEWLYQYACAIEWLGAFGEEESAYARAIEIFSHLLLIDPDFPRIHQRIAYCYVQLGHITAEPDFYKRAVHFFRLAVRQDEENEQVWLDWGLCLVDLAHLTIDADFMSQLYLDAEQKISRAGQLGSSSAHYALCCLYSLLGRLSESMELLFQALETRTIPSLEQLLEDEWLYNLRQTEGFEQFVQALEAKLQQSREE